ncbi:hypothetical protein GCM10010507_47430 [Streptomyces cinnamoneus]|uniref:Uncharacterized protein n=1 Tax=Streptomyces cinnamoneus TaxID=53446 RepID=A0A918TWA0_STRCJ|nr:hypothetical protein GCM10010507_47430 [Streptomyces cinnamoneus]
MCMSDLRGRGTAATGWTGPLERRDPMSPRRESVKGAGGEPATPVTFGTNGPTGPFRPAKPARQPSSALPAQPPLARLPYNQFRPVPVTPA